MKFRLLSSNLRRESAIFIENESRDIPNKVQNWYTLVNVYVDLVVFTHIAGTS